MPQLNVVLLTGISGSGKSVALRLLEDAGYTCVDNLPVRFLHEFIGSMRGDPTGRVAISIDVRSPGELDELPDLLDVEDVGPGLSGTHEGGISPGQPAARPENDGKLGGG